MTAACLLTIAALLVGADDPDPVDLIRRLGSAHFAERVEATKALEKLGSAALPALRAARDSENPTVRVRVEALLKTLDRAADVDRLTRPTLIKLDFHDRPLSETLDELNARHNLGLTLHFGPPPGRGMVVFGGLSPAQKAKEDEVRSRRVTLEADRPLPFWEAVDRLCEVGHLQHDLQTPMPFGLSAGRLLLFSGLGGTSLTSDHGPIRVKVTGLHSTFERDLGGAIGPTAVRQVRPGRAHGDRDLSVGMAFIPEPGLVVRPVGPATYAEATDDQGRSLLPPDPPKPGPDQNHQRPDLNGASGFRLIAALRLHDQAGRSIRRLRGSVPVVVVGYSADSIAIPLKGGAGQSARNDDVTVTILEVAKDENAGVTVEVEVTPNRPIERQADPRNRSGPPDLVTFRDYQLTTRLELLDADGRKLALDWSPGHGRDHLTNIRRVRMTPTTLYEDQPPDAAGHFQPRKAMRPVPVELRYRGFAQSSTEIPFDFHDIPLP